MKNIKQVRLDLLGHKATVDKGQKATEELEVCQCQLNIFLFYVLRCLSG